MDKWVLLTLLTTEVVLRKCSNRIFFLHPSPLRIEDNNNISGVGAKGFDFFHFNERLHKLEQLAQNTSKNAIDKEQKLNETIFQLQLLKEQLLLNQKSDEMVSTRGHTQLVLDYPFPLLMANH